MKSRQIDGQGDTYNQGLAENLFKTQVPDIMNTRGFLIRIQTFPTITVVITLQT